MLDSLRNGVKIIEYHPTYRLHDIDVLAILDMFEDRSETLMKLTKEKEPMIIAKPIDREKEQRITVYKNEKFRLWKRKAKIIIFVSLACTLLLWLLYKTEPLFIGTKETWNSFKKSDYVWIIGLMVSFGWNAIVGKMFYERHFDPSKEKAFKENLNIPDNI